MHGATRYVLQQALDAKVIDSFTAEVQGAKVMVTMHRAGLSGPVTMPEREAAAWLSKVLSLQSHPSMRETAAERAMRAWKMDTPPRTVHTVIPTL